MTQMKGSRTKKRGKDNFCKTKIELLRYVEAMNTSFWEKTVSKSICYGAYLATLSNFKRRRTRGTFKFLIQAVLQRVNFPFLSNGLRYFQSCKIDFGSQYSRRTDPKLVGQKFN